MLHGSLATFETPLSHLMLDVRTRTNVIDTGDEKEDGVPEDRHGDEDGGGWLVVSLVVVDW
jgi:hypothetical protein